jgi:hypothetical protein
MEFPGLVNAVVATFVELSLVAAVVAVAAPKAGVPVKVGLARGALRARAVTSASERGKEAKVALFVTPASTNGIVSVESGLATVVSSEILGI